MDSRGLRGEGVCIGFVRSGRYRRFVFVRELTILCIAWLCASLFLLQSSSRAADSSDMGLVGLAKGPVAVLLFSSVGSGGLGLCLF